MPAKKKIAAAIAIIAAFLLMTAPQYRSERVIMAGNGTLNYTSDDYYGQYYGANASGEFVEHYIEFRSPADAFNYYCEPSSYPSLQVGVFLDQPGLACYGIKTPLTETGYDSYDYHICYGFRVAESAGCLYG